MIGVSMTVAEGPMTRRIKVRAATLEQELQIVGFGTNARVISVTSPAPAARTLDPAADHEPDRVAPRAA